VAERPWLINGSLLVEPGDGVVFEPYALRIAVVDWERNRLLSATMTMHGLLRTIAEIIKEKPAVLTVKRQYNCGPYGCDKVYLPDMETIAELLLALRSVLSSSPKEIEAEDDDGHRYWVWSREEVMAVRKAAILLDITAMLLKNPREMLQKLPRDVELLVNKHANGGLDRYVPRSAAEASTAAEG